MKSMRCCSTGWGGGGPCLTLSLGVAAVAIHLLSGAESHLQYERSAIAAGEVWRILTCHLTHVTGEHLFWDLLPFVVLGTLLERTSRRKLSACLFGSALLVPAAVWILDPGLEIYRGLSGVATALLALLAVELISERRKTAMLAGWLMIAALTAKIVFEFLTDSSWVVSGGLVPVPLAHIAGAAVGLWVGGSGRETRQAAPLGRDVCAPADYPFPRADRRSGPK